VKFSNDSPCQKRKLTFAVHQVLLSAEMDVAYVNLSLLVLQAFILDCFTILKDPFLDPFW